MTAIVILSIVCGATLIVLRASPPLLTALAIYAVCFSAILLDVSGWHIALATALGNLTAVAILALAFGYSDIDRGVRWGLRQGGDSGVPSDRSGERERSLGDLFVRLTLVLLALAIAFGLTSRPIADSLRAFAGVSSFAACWSLMAGLATIVLWRDYLQLGAGLTLVVNAGLMFYLAVAPNLEAKVILSALTLTVTLALGSAYLEVMSARIRRSAGNKTTEEGTAAQFPTQSAAPQE